MTRLTPVFLIAGLTLAGCNQATERRAENVAGSAEATAEAVGDRIENAADNAIGAMKPTPSARNFVNQAVKSDAFEIAAAKLASTQAASPEVKAFAAQMVEAHTASTAKIKAAAGKAKPAIQPDPALTADQNEDLAELRKLTGARFDEEYVDGQVDAHEDALVLMRSYASGGTDTSLKAVAGAIAPVVEGHLKMARQLEAKTDR